MSRLLQIVDRAGRAGGREVGRGRTAAGGHTIMFTRFLDFELLTPRDLLSFNTWRALRGGRGGAVQNRNFEMKRQGSDLVVQRSR